MRRIARPQRPIDALLTSSRHPRPHLSSSPCLACGYRTTSLSKARHPSNRTVTQFSTSTQRREPLFKPKNPKKSKAFTDSIQAKLWGGKENVLGRKDPYDRNSPLRMPVEREAEIAEPADKQRILEAEEVSEEYDDEVRAEAEYEEATTWDGLERVGNKQWVEKYKDRKRGRLHFTQGYLPSTKITDSEALNAALHRAIVEVFTLQKAGLDLSLTSKGFALNHEPVSIQSVKVGLSEDKTSAALTFSDPNAESAMVEALEDLSKISQDAIAETTSTLDSADTIQDTQETVDSSPDDASVDTASTATSAGQSSFGSEAATSFEGWSMDWESISIQDPDIKFAVVKRLMQLTGHRLSDPIIQDTNSAGQLLSRVTTPPKPKKLIEAIERDGRLKQISNVKVSGRRVTSIDKEQEVGRWKVIEYALRERGLPVVHQS